ncbi:hypothetical protein QBC39DRAFT_22837 [Podospora conica]|nr:hypothetical protein QBC39DRAFT_22837 [Schizothecium conicum]
MPPLASQLVPRCPTPNVQSCSAIPIDTPRHPSPRFPEPGSSPATTPDNRRSRRDRRHPSDSRRVCHHEDIKTFGQRCWACRRSSPEILERLQLGHTRLDGRGRQAQCASIFSPTRPAQDDIRADMDHLCESPEHCPSTPSSGKREGELPTQVLVPCTAAMRARMHQSTMMWIDPASGDCRISEQPGSLWIQSCSLGKGDFLRRSTIHGVQGGSP